MDSTSISGSASKAVVGVALAAVFGTGVYIYAVRSAHDTQVAQAPAAIAAAPTAPPAADPQLAPPGTTAQGPVSAATPPAAAPAPSDSQDAPAPAQRSETAAANADGKADSKISSEVKTQIAAAAPNSNVNVTTSNGTVALAGSVPSQDALNQAKLAAQSVDGVKTVDTSNLMVASNQ